MSEDDEVLRTGSDLSNHLVDDGYIDFKTYQTLKCHSLENVGDQSSVGSIDVVYHLSQIPSCDHKCIVKILNSKLLLEEDAQLIKGMLQTQAVKKTTWYSTAIMAGLSIVSQILLFKKELRYSIPISLTAICSSYLVWQLIKTRREREGVNLVDSYIKDLLNLNINIHKLLRFLKEMEILSTGQVSTINISAAMYMFPIINDYDQYPSWKTLPHLRRCLAESLEEVTEIINEACNKAIYLLPEWMKIEGYINSNQSTLLKKLLTIRNQNKSVDFYSIKDLQILSNVYLVLQSEYLRWIAMIFCTGYECELMKLQNKQICRVEIFKLMNKTKHRIKNISLKLKKHFVLQSLYYTDKTGLNEKHKDKSELAHLQTEVHNLFLSVLITVTKIRELEDRLQNICSSKMINVDEMKKDVTQELDTVREELYSAVKHYNEIFNLFTQKKKKEANDNDSLKSETEDVNVPKEDFISKNIAEPEMNIDEVFIGKSASKDINRSIDPIDDWESEARSQIPKTLLSELSETLKPIKEDFKERERKALERSGIEDIEEIEKPMCGVLLTLNNSHISRPKKDQHEENIMEGSVIENRNINDNVRSDVEKSNHEDSCVISTSLLAKIAAKKSQEWRKNSEQFYSDE